MEATTSSQVKCETVHHNDEIPAAELVDVHKHYRLPRTRLFSGRDTLRAADGVSLRVPAGGTLGLVGESGSGKSTVARLLVRLTDVTSGRVLVAGDDVTDGRGDTLRRLRRQVQMVFQDPYSSFDPYSRLGDSIAEPLRTHMQMSGTAREKRVRELLDRVGLGRHLAARYPNELSGGQLQRAAVARALSVEPGLLVLDEPVSALDVSTQAQVVNLLQQLQDEADIAYLFIAHDLSVVRHMVSDVAVMYLGRIVEQGPAEAIYRDPAHPYTLALLSAVPIPHPATQRSRLKVTLQGDTPSPVDPPSGCRFRTRCPWAMDICAAEEPPATVTPAGVTTYCHLHTGGPALAGRGVNTLEPPVPE